LPAPATTVFSFSAIIIQPSEKESPAEAGHLAFIVIAIYFGQSY
jgi:hypothetical protein